jgi:hypothetical protein
VIGDTPIQLVLKCGITGVITGIVVLVGQFTVPVILAAVGSLGIAGFWRRKPIQLHVTVSRTIARIATSSILFTLGAAAPSASLVLIPILAATDAPTPTGTALLPENPKSQAMASATLTNVEPQADPSMAEASIGGSTEPPRRLSSNTKKNALALLNRIIESLRASGGYELGSRGQALGKNGMWYDLVDMDFPGFADGEASGIPMVRWKSGDPNLNPCWRKLGIVCTAYDGPDAVAARRAYEAVSDLVHDFAVAHGESVEAYISPLRAGAVMISGYSVDPLAPVSDAAARHFVGQVNLNWNGYEGHWNVKLQVEPPGY